MSLSGKFVACAILTAGLFAQGPPPGGGHRGFGPRPDIMSAGPGSRTPVTGAPYSGTQVTQSQQTLADGNQISRQEQSKVYRDSQGRVRIEHTMNGPGAAGTTPHTVISIFDPVAGYSYMLNPATMTAVKRPLPPPKSAGSNGGPNSPRHPRGPEISGAQVQTENLGTQMVNGVSATGTRNTETIPAGAIGNQQPLAIVRETWVSTELKVPVQIKSSDPRFGNMTMQLTNIAQAEPDPSLFQVPSTYTVTAQAAGPGRWMH